MTDDAILDELLEQVRARTLRVLNDEAVLGDTPTLISDDPDGDAINACVLSMVLLVRRRKL